MGLRQVGEGRFGHHQVVAESFRRLRSSVAGLAGPGQARMLVEVALHALHGHASGPPRANAAGHGHTPRARRGRARRPCRSRRPCLGICETVMRPLPVTGDGCAATPIWPGARAARTPPTSASRIRHARRQPRRASCASFRTPGSASVVRPWRRDRRARASRTRTTVASVGPEGVGSLAEGSEADLLAAHLHLSTAWQRGAKSLHLWATPRPRGGSPGRSRSAAPPAVGRRRPGPVAKRRGRQHPTQILRLADQAWQRGACRRPFCHHPSPRLLEFE